MRRKQAADGVAGYRRLEELVPAHWREDTVFANGIRQHYWRTGGAGPPVVLLHGMQGSGLTWLRVARALEDAFDLVMPDARGHGRTDLGAAFTLRALTEDVAGLIEVLGLEQPALVGHSLGGATTAFVAADFPESVSRVVLEEAVWGEEPALSEAVVQSEGYQRWLAGFIACVEQLPHVSHAERMAAALPYLAPGAEAWREEVYVPWAGAQAELSLRMLRQAPELWWSMEPPRSLRRLVDDIRCPMLLLTGGRSNIDSQMAEQIAAAAREARHVRIAEAGHLIHVDVFEAYVEVVRGFLKWGVMGLTDHMF